MVTAVAPSRPQSPGHMRCVEDGVAVSLRPPPRPGRPRGLGAQKTRGGGGSGRLGGRGGGVGQGLHWTWSIVGRGRGHGPGAVVSGGGVSTSDLLWGSGDWGVCTGFLEILWNFL